MTAILVRKIDVVSLRENLQGGNLMTPRGTQAVGSGWTLSSRGSPNHRTRDERFAFYLHSAGELERRKKKEKCEEQVPYDEVVQVPRISGHPVAHEQGDGVQSRRHIVQAHDQAGVPDRENFAGIARNQGVCDPGAVCTAA